MTCRELIDFLMDYTDGGLPEQVRAEFDRHLAVCPSCAAYLDTYRRTVDLAKEAHCVSDDEPVPADVPRGLVNAILAARRRQDSQKGPGR